MELVILQSVVLLVVLYLTLRFWTRNKYRDFYNLPIPQGHWLLGNLGDLIATDPHIRLTKYADKYGGMFRVNTLGLDILVLSELKAVANVIAKSGLNLPKSHLYETTRLFITRSGNAQDLFTMKYDNEEYKAIRKPLAAAFSTQSLRCNAFPIAMDCYQTFLEQLNKRRREHADGVVNMDLLFQQLMFDFTGKWGFGMEYDTLSGKNAHLFAAFHHYLREMSIAAYQPFRVELFRQLPFLPAAKKAHSAMDQVFGMYEQLAAAVKAKGEPEPDDNSLWACLARMKNPHTQEPLNDLDFQANTAVLLVAGFDTTSHTLGWLMYDIARHPAVQLKIREELAAAGLVATTPRAPPPRQLTFQDLVKFPYVNAVIKEGMRVHPVGPMGSSRLADSDVMINGVLVPKGTVVNMPTHTIQNSTHNVVQPDTFLPERWIDSASVAASSETPVQTTEPRPAGVVESGSELGLGDASLLMHQGSSQRRGVLLGFMEGPRDCVGQNLAMMMVRLLVLLLCSQFWWEVALEMGRKEHVKSKETFALVLTYPGGIKLKCRPHAIETAG